MRMRLSAHYGEVFTCAFYDADILTERSDVALKAGAVNDYLFADFLKIVADPDPDHVSEEKIIESSTTIAKLHGELRAAMRADLNETL